MAQPIPKRNRREGVVWPEYVVDGLLLFYNGMNVSAKDVITFIHHWDPEIQTDAISSLLTETPGEKNYGDLIPPSELRQFIIRLESFQHEDIYLRVFSEGQDHEKQMAICMYGKSDLPQVRETLLPFLRSSSPKERWLTAIVLGERGEHTAFPFLVTMLTEYLPTRSSPTIELADAWFDQYRGLVARLLDEANIPSLIPIFRKAFISTLQAEQIFSAIQFARPQLKHFYLKRWYHYQDSLAHRLGRREAFGVLTDMLFLPEHLRLAIVNMALGYCRVEEFLVQVGPPFDWQADERFSHQVKVVLEERFGLSEEERNDCLQLYRADYYSSFRLRDGADT